MARFAHVINPVKIGPQSDLYIAQPITFESMENASRFSSEAKVDLYAAAYEEDMTMTPDSFRQLPPLTASVKDFLDEDQQSKKLPLLKDILEPLIESADHDYIVYTNVDIGLFPHFYDYLEDQAKQGIDALTITRRTILKKYSSSDQLPDIYSRIGKGHPGFDCFMFHRRMFEQFDLGTICIGAPPVGKILLLNMQLFSQNYSLVEDAHLTFHLGEDRVWLQNEFQPNQIHNIAEAKMIIDRLESKLGPISREDFPICAELDAIH